MLAQFDRRQRDLEPKLLGKLLGLFIEHDQDKQAPAALRDPGPDFLVAQEIVVHILDRAEFMRSMLARHRDLGVGSVESIEEIDIFEFVDPAPEAEEVVGGGREEIDRRLVVPEKFVDI